MSRQPDQAQLAADRIAIASGIVRLGELPIERRLPVILAARNKSHEDH